MIREEEALQYHAAGRPGKIEIRPTKSALSRWELRLAYLPGAAFPSRAIVEDPSKVYRYTAKGNLVGVITNGTDVRGLGNIGPDAAKPLQEGIAVIFKRLADIDVFDLELSALDSDRFVDAVRMLEPTFGGISLKDIRAPEGLYIHERLCEVMNIPVFHQDLYSLAVVAAAGLLNALDLAEKKISEARVVICGMGNVGMGCGRLFLRLGVRPENLLAYDAKGLLHPDRDDIPEYQRAFVRKHPARDLAAGLKDADVFLGASVPGVITQKMVLSMNPFPVVLSLSTPEPEIGYESARACRRDVIVGTSLSQYPNAISDLLSFPYIFRGALDVQATRITEGMLIAAARALAGLAKEDVPEEVEQAYGREHFSFGPEYLLPKPIDHRILVHESSAVAQQAIREGVARIIVEDDAYRERLTIRLGKGREPMRALVMKARQGNPSVVFSDGSSETVLRACALLADEGMASPILLGREEEVRQAAERLDLDLGGMRIINPGRSPRFEQYVDEYFRMRCRRGVMREEAHKRLLQHDYFGALMLHMGECDMVFTGISTYFAESLRKILRVIGPGPGIRRVSSHHLILLPKDIYLLADCGVNIDPSAEELAEIAMLAANNARLLGMEPRVAMLSFSNYGNVDHPYSRKVRLATEIVKEKAAQLIIDGEMQLSVALSHDLRNRYFPFSLLQENANVLIFPDLQSGSLALNMLQHMADAVVVGPLLMGTRLPVHLLQYGIKVQEVVNLATVGIVEASADSRQLHVFK